MFEIIAKAWKSKLFREVSFTASTMLIHLSSRSNLTEKWQRRRRSRKSKKWNSINERKIISSSILSTVNVRTMRWMKIFSSPSYFRYLLQNVVQIFQRQLLPRLSSLVSLDDIRFTILRSLVVNDDVDGTFTNSPARKSNVRISFVAFFFN